MAKFLSKINSPDYINNKIVKIDEDNNLIPSALAVLEYDSNQISISLADGNVSQRILITDDATSNTNVYNFQQKNDPSQEYQDLMVIKDNGHVVANVFEGNLQGNANTSTQVKVTDTSPSTATTYRLVFTEASATGNANLRINNSDVQLSNLEGTTSTQGFANLVLGNGVASGTTGNKYGKITLYSTNTGYDVIQTSSHTGTLTHTFPNSSGILLNSVNYKSYALPLTGGTITGPISVAFGGTWIDGYKGLNSIINSTAPASSQVTLWRKNLNSGVGAVYAYTDMIGFSYQDNSAIEDNTNAVKYSVGLNDNGSFMPGISNLVDLGTSSYKWKNVYATTFYGTLSGNASSATKLQTARTINGVAFDGTKNITIDVGGSGHTILNSSGTAMTQRSKLRFNNATVTDDADNDVTIITPSGTSGNYLPLSGGTMTGDIHFSHVNAETDGYLAWDSGTVKERIKISDRTATTDPVFVFEQSRDGGNSYTSLLTIKGNGQVQANTFVGALSGNAATATKLQTARTINGTSFNGSANITTANWGTARNIGIVNSDGTGTAVTTSVNGSANVNLKLPATIKATLTGNASTATTLANARTINGTSFNGSANITTANWGTARTITIGNTGKSVNGSANITWSLSEIGAAASSHTHSYLPLAGGTMTGTISSSKTTGTYLAGSQGTAVINSTASGGSYTTLLKANSSNGKFTLSIYQTYMLLGYMSNKTIEAGNNNLDKSLRFLEDGTLIPGASNVQNLGSSSTKWLNVYATTFTGNLAGNATTATTATKANQLTTARTIAISGGVTGTATSFNGTANITIPVTAVDASKLTNKNTIKASEINNNKHWIPSNDNSVTNFVSMTVDEYEESADSLPTGTVVAITDSNESYVTTQPSSITCDLPLDL